MKMKTDDTGSASIEATISLFAFLMAMMTIYLFLNLCIVQARIAFAVEAAAKDMAQYSYLYHAFGLEEMVDGFKDQVEEKKQMAAGLLDSLGLMGQEGEIQIRKAVTDPQDYFGKLSGELSFGTIKNTALQVENAVKNPQELMGSMIALAGSEWMKGKHSNLVAAPLAKVLVKHHLGDMDLERFGVKGGSDGMNFNLSTMLEDDGDITVIVVYEIDLSKVVPFFSPFLVCQRAQAKAWLGGDQGK